MRRNLDAEFDLDKVAEWADEPEQEVEVSLDCAGCGREVEGVGDSERDARKHLRTRIPGWAVIFDRKVNDGPYAYCPECIQRLFPDLKERLKMEKAGVKTATRKEVR